MFESNDFPMTEEGKEVDHSESIDIIRSLMGYITGIKGDQKNRDISLIDVIIDFSFKNNLDVQTVGDIISEDEYFKSFIEKDCADRNIIKNDSIKEW